MQKTKIGISVGLFGAALYFIGLLSVIPLVIMAGYVLLLEHDEWLRKTAVKAVAVVVFFAVISAFIGLVSNSSSLLVDVILLFRVSIDIDWLSNILSICRTVISFIQTLLLLMLGFNALKQENIKLSFVDNAINRHM